MSKSKKENINNQMLMELNVLEGPLFKFDKSPKEQTKMEEYTLEWSDSRGLKRRLHMTSPLTLPRQREMDTLFALVELFIRQNSPITYDVGTNEFNISSHRVYFSFYELLKHMGKDTGGAAVESLKQAIRILKSTTYMSQLNGVFFDKGEEKYIVSKEKGFSLINDYSFDSKKKENREGFIEEEQEKNWIELNSLIIKNIKQGYFKYLDHNVFYSLPSGLTRRLYAYVEKQRYENGRIVTRLRRKYATLADKLPLEYKYLSEIKKRIKQCEKDLIKTGFMTDIDYQKEYVDFYFIGKKEDYTTEVVEEIEDNSESRPKSYLRPIGDDLVVELVKRGIGKRVAKNILSGKREWDVKKIIIYADKQLWLNNIKNNYAGFLRTAIVDDFYVDHDQEIVEYVENLKKERLNAQEVLDNDYDLLISERIEDFKVNEPQVYNLYKEQAFLFIKNNSGRILDINNNRQLFEEQGDEFSLVQDKLKALIIYHLKLPTKSDYIRAKKNEDSKVS